MPIFEYGCRKCGQTFEKLVLAGREVKINCPNCNCEEVEKKISAPFLPSSVGRPANDCSVPNCGGQTNSGGCQTGGG